MQDVQSTQDTVRPKRPLLAWFDVRSRKLGSWAFALNRLTGLGLVLYLFLHLVILSLLLRGEAGWDAFIKLARSPLFLLMDAVLIFGIIYHGLNGIRVGMVGLGYGVRAQRGLFWTLMVIGAALLVASIWLVFTI
ncbi:MAG: succinate dehydrogenase, cytochrome b556 subunit [Anaerolineae bacterium]|nr:succinate dehydrogenase, cytochrome b556 subunit [Anaerolineae bacterium]